MHPIRTKIVCTLGPATSTYEGIEALYNAGMSVVRLNMSHADHDSAAKVIGWIKTLNRKVRYPVPIMLDTQGPEIRTGMVNKPIDLEPNQVVTISVRDSAAVEETSIHVNYNELVDVLSVGDRLTVDNGLINFEVLERQGEQMVCRVLDGGTLGSKRHVNLPGIKVNLPAITPKDREDILFGLEHDVDFIALSFVRAAQDVFDLRELMGAKAKNVHVIAKIEDQEGVNNVHEIAKAADGVMVARGDLGIETSIADLPNVQRRIVHACAMWGRRCTLGRSAMLVSIPRSPRATMTPSAALAIS